MSIAIIFTYLKEYKKLFGIEPDDVQKEINSRKPLRYYDPKTKNKILWEVKYLSDGYNVQ